MGKINTFLIGAQKAGTTSLYNWLGQHPDVHAPSETKDYHFFSNEQLYQKGISHLVKFYNDDEKKVQLHAAVNYLFFYKEVARRLYNYNPEAKIIICLRNPVDRAISAYKYFVRINREENLFKTALYRELNGELEQNEMSDHTYLKHGKYMEQINGFLEFFDRSQCHFLVFEEMINKDKRSNLISNLFQFLNIDSSFKVDYTHRNKSGQPKSNFVNRLIRDDYLLKLIVKKMFPYKLRKKVGKRIEELNITDKKIEVNIEKEQKDLMENYFKNTVQKLENFLERNLSDLWMKNKKI